MLYAGGSGNGAHEFVCDGYDANGYFHFNMGWGGQSDGYYLTTATGYDLYQDVFFNIRKNEGNSESLVAYQTTDFKYDDQLQALTAKSNEQPQKKPDAELDFWIRNAVHIVAAAVRTGNVIAGLHEVSLRHFFFCHKTVLLLSLLQTV